MSDPDVAPLILALVTAHRAADPAAALERACELIVDAGATGARLIVFPEGFLGPLIVPGPAADRLGRAACRARCTVVLGTAAGTGQPGVLILSAQGEVLPVGRRDAALPLAFVALPWAPARGGGAAPAPAPRAGGI